MSLIYDLETDIRYIQGTEKGIEIGTEKGIEIGTEIGTEKTKYEDRRLFVTNLILETDFNNEKIAKLADVSIEFVEHIRQELNQNAK